MKITKINEPEIVMCNTMSKHNYFAWPTVARLKNGNLAVVASGFRLQHICPFGKTVISFSADDGAHYTLPAPVIDTPLDDRDGGILPFGESGVIVTSFNNTLDFQREIAEKSTTTAYRLSYLNTVSKEEETHYLGSTFRISFDNGITFGKLYKSPVTSPHGPIQRKNGDIIWVGRHFGVDDCICAYLLHPQTGEMEYLGRIDDVFYLGEKQLSCEPFTFELDDGTLLCHIRVQSPDEVIKDVRDMRFFTIYQSTSSDGGKTWSSPEPLLSEFGGAPAHIMRHSSGILLSVYGFRGSPYGTKPYEIKAMFSRDNGKTWDSDYIIYSNEVSEDIGYPSTVELSDGSLLTVFYAKEQTNSPAVIMQQRWRFEDEI